MNYTISEARILELANKCIENTKRAKCRISEKTGLEKVFTMNLRFPVVILNHDKIRAKLV